MAESHCLWMLKVSSILQAWGKGDLAHCPPTRLQESAPCSWNIVCEGGQAAQGWPISFSPETFLGAVWKQAVLKGTTFLTGGESLQGNEVNQNQDEI